MYPLLLKASAKDYLWGGTRLKEEYGFEADSSKVAEAWVLSAHNNGQSIALNGEMKGKTLGEILQVWGKEAVGKHARKLPDFPILIKLIDSKDKLSVQVHPDDAYALKHEGEFGKTEMWYVVDCCEGASLVYGVDRPISRDEFEKRINNHTLLEVCNCVPVKKGDVFLVEAGTLHAIGNGILIVEVQQNSNITYRIYDYARVGADGKPRPLHIEKALDVTSLTPTQIPYGDIGDTSTTPFGRIRQLAKCDLFEVSHLELDGTTEMVDDDSFISLVFLDGQAQLCYGSERIKAKKGSSIFIPATVKTVLSGQAEILISKV